MLSLRRMLCGATLPLALLGCGDSAPESRTPSEPARPDVKQPTELSFASVPPGTVGPYLSAGDDGAIALWGQTDEAASGWYSRRLGPDGKARAKVRHVAALGGLPGLVRFRPFGGQLLAAWSREVEGGQEVVALKLAPSGAALGEPTVVAGMEARPLWLEVLEVGDGALAFWAERSGSDARLLAAALTEDGAAAGAPKEISNQAKAWQVVSANGRAVMALVDDRRQLDVLVLDRNGDVTERREVPNAERMNSEVDLVVSGDRLLLAFSATPLLDTQVYLAVLGLDGTPVAPPRPAVAALGDQTLLRLLVGRKQSYLVWQDTAQAPDLLKVKSVDKGGRSTGSPLWVPWDGVTPAPEFAVQEDELRALVWACVTGLDCDEPVVPALVELDDELRPRSVAPWLGDGRIPDLAWSLTCEDDGCLGLAAVFGTPTRVYALGGEAMDGEWVTPVFNEPAEKPTLAALEALLEPLPLSAIDGTGSEQGTLVAWLSDFDPAVPYKIPDEPAPDGRRKPVRAELHTQWIPARFGSEAPGEQLPPDEVISYRARSLGGVSLSQGEKQSLLVWAAVDGKTPQVFTTLIDARGKKVAQNMLTRQKGEITNLTSLVSGTDWVVGWVDDRDGKPRARVTRLSPTLARRVPDVPVGPSDANTSGVALRVQGEELWHVRADAAGQTSALTLARLDLRNMKTRSEVKLTTGKNAHSPVFLDGSERPMLAWIAERDGHTVLEAARLSESGEPSAMPLRIETAHTPITLSGHCRSSGCRLVVTTQSAETQYLEAFEFTESALKRGRTVAAILSPQALFVAPRLLGDEAWFYDVSQRGRPRLQRARIEF